MVLLAELTVTIEVSESLPDQEALQLLGVLQDRLTRWAVETQADFGASGLDLRFRVDV